MLSDFATHLACKLVVDCVSRTCGDDSTADRLADKCHVADDVEQLVACRLILPNKRLSVKITKFLCVAMLCANHVGKFVECILRYFSLVDNDSVVEVAALNQSGCQ